MATEPKHPDNELTTPAVHVTHPRDYQFDRLAEIAVTPAALTKSGSTTHFVVSYDNSLGNDGPTIAQAVLDVCEADYSTLQGYFGGITPPSLPFNINILPGNFGASHATCAATTLSIGARSAPGVNIPFIRSLVIAEEDEVFEAAIGRGWDCGASNGEGLSRVLANAMYPGAEPSNFVSAPSWLDSNRPDYVNNTDQTDRNYVSIGCAVLFLNWLRYQLHFCWNEIILAGATTLAQTYTNLTGRTDAWTRFTTLLQNHFPVGKPSGLTTDNPFPLLGKAWDVIVLPVVLNQLYLQVLEREVDPVGLIGWGCILNRGEQSMRDIVRNIGHSQEYHDRFIAPLTTADAVKACYRHFLAREADPAGLQFWEGVATQQGFLPVIDGIVASDEYTNKFGSDLVPQ